MIIVGHAHAYQTSKEKGSNAEQVSELYANKIIYYPEEDRTIAVGDVHATVYPKSGGATDKKKKKDKKSKKKKKKKSSAKDEETSKNEAQNEMEEVPEGVPLGEYLKIPAEGSSIDAVAEDDE
jgi:hypothetical protein